MRVAVPVLWSVVFSLLVETCRAQKVTLCRWSTSPCPSGLLSVPQLKVLWGPQSMMYLKGRHGRRFVSEEDSRDLTWGLQDWSAQLRGILKLQSQASRKSARLLTSQRVLIHLLQER